MLFEIVFQSARAAVAAFCGCDLMLFEIVFQSSHPFGTREWGCDLMLFEIVFQSYVRVELGKWVVI